MKIAVVGVGQVGAYYAEQWHRAGHELILTYYRNQNKVETFASALGRNVSIAPPEQATTQAEVILFCPRFEHIEDAAKQMGDIGHKILIDANNPFNPERTGIANLAPHQTAAKVVANLFPQAFPIKALHNLGIQTILDNSFRKLVGFIAGDDNKAVKIVADLLKEAHLEPMLTGSFETSALSEFPGPLFGLAFTKEEAEVALKQALSNDQNPNPHS